MFGGSLRQTTEWENENGIENENTFKQQKNQRGIILNRAEGHMRTTNEDTRHKTQDDDEDKEHFLNN